MPKSFNFKQLIEQVEQHESQSGRVHAAAKWYVANGFPVMPSNPGSKAHAEGFNPNNGVKTVEKVDELFGPGGRFEGCDLSLGTGPVGAGISIIDLDVKDELDGIERFAELCELFGEIEDGPAQITPSGGRHILVEHEEGLTSSTSVIAKGIDTKGHKKGDVNANGGHFLVYPSRRKTPDGWVDYRWYGESFKIPHAPRWVVDRILGRRPILQELDLPEFIPEGERNTTLYLKGLHIICHGIRKGLAESEINEHLAEFEMRCENYKPGMGKSAFESAWKSDEVEREYKKTDMAGGLIYNDKGLLQKHVLNIIAIFESNMFFNEIIPARWDNFKQQIVLLNNPDANLDEVINEIELALAREWFELSGDSIRKMIMNYAPQVLKKKFEIDSLRDYFEGLVWDGVDRFPGLCGAIGATTDNEGMTLSGNPMFEELRGLERVYIKKFMVGAVAKAYQPGCKGDSMLVLAGRQGTGKSTFARYLTPGEYPDAIANRASDGESWNWFTDNIGKNKKLTDADEIRKQRGKFIGEMAEMHALKAYEITAMKNFLSEQAGEHVEKWEKGVTRTPRRMVFIGTTNKYEYLGDSTGNRRFWNIDVGWHEIDTQWVYENRDQLWAQARVLYEGGETWWLDREDMKLQEVSNREYFESDEWEVEVQRFVADKSRFKTETVLRALGVMVSDQGDRNKTGARVNRIIKNLETHDDQHWKMVYNILDDGTRTRVWRNPNPDIDDRFPKNAVWDPRDQQAKSDEQEF
jgi:predicted P-loop ATPase